MKKVVSFCLTGLYLFVGGMVGAVSRWNETRYKTRNTRVPSHIRAFEILGEAANMSAAEFKEQALNIARSEEE